MRIGTIAVVLGLSLGAVAQAGINVTITNLGPATWANGTPQELPGFSAWKLSVATNDGYQITAFDFWTPENTYPLYAHPSYGIFGPLAQRWTWNTGDEAWEASPYKTTTNSTTNAFSNDSHFLFQGTYPSQLPPVEDNNGLGLLGRNNDLINTWGMGSYLRQVCTVPLLTSTNIAYLVIPDGQRVQAVGQVVTTSPVNDGKNLVNVYVGNIPEPACLALAAMGALALLRRRGGAVACAAILAVLLLAPPSAQAGVDVTVTNLGVPTWSNGTPQELSGFTAWKVSIATNDGSDILSMDFLSKAATGPFGHPDLGFFGPLAQRWTWNAGDEQWEGSAYKTYLNNTSNAFSNDSHFLILGTFNSYAPPVEDNDGAGLTGRHNDLLNTWGMGTFLQEYCTVPDAPSQDVAYLVVPNGRQIHMVGQIATTSYINNGRFNLDVYIVPEPSGMALALAGCGALAHRRRRSM